jgi:hypothetical protein
MNFAAPNCLCLITSLHGIVYQQMKICTQRYNYFTLVVGKVNDLFGYDVLHDLWSVLRLRAGGTVSASDVLW